MTVLLRREGFVVNHKKVYRLYREEGLAVRSKEAEETGWRREGDAFPAGG